MIFIKLYHSEEVLSNFSTRRSSVVETGAYVLNVQTKDTEKSRFCFDKSYA